MKVKDIELAPDAWERFERAVDAVVKGGPQHRTRDAGAPSICNILQRLATLAERSNNARAAIREFLDNDLVLGTLEIDRAATMRTGHTIFFDEPSEHLLSCLVAVSATDSKTHALRNGKPGQ